MNTIKEMWIKHPFWLEREENDEIFFIEKH